MGQLRRAATGEVFRLGPRCLIGRNPTCDVRIDNRRVSGEHASIHFNGSHWELRDLRSTNGTYVGTKRIEREVLSVGTQFQVGGVNFELIDAASPVASARHLSSDAIRYAEAGTLMLPDEDHPIASIYEAKDGRWRLESATEQRDVVDRDVVIVGGERWLIDIPDASIATLDTARFGLMLETISLRFLVSRDEDRVELTIVHDHGDIRLGTRKYFLILFILARAWLEDTTSPAAERGWVERDWLCDALDVEGGKLNVDIHRARRELSSRNVHGAVDLVERRIDTGQLRIGVPRIEIVQQRANDDGPAEPPSSRYSFEPPSGPLSGESPSGRYYGDPPSSRLSFDPPNSEASNREPVLPQPAPPHPSPPSIEISNDPFSDKTDPSFQVPRGLQADPPEEGDGRTTLPTSDDDDTPPRSKR